MEANSYRARLSWRDKAIIVGAVAGGVIGAQLAHYEDKSRPCAINEVLQAACERIAERNHQLEAERGSCAGDIKPKGGQR